jgi:serine phosphatase RsbU (regulator of sigma subunit)
VGDVCGKGADAAALTGLVRHSLRAVAPRQPGPHEIVGAVHDILLAESADDGKFCTMVCAVLRPDPGGASISVVCAGHPTPLVRRADGSVVEIPSRGGLLGALADTVIPQPTVVHLDAGDVAVFYTDGVTEARRAGSIFGEARLRATLRASNGDARSVADAVVAAVDDYTEGEPRDDIAILAVGVEERSDRVRAAP